MGGKKKIVCGVGINDADYVVQINEELPRRPCGGRRQKCIWVCPYYNTWKSMIVRCYSEKDRKKYPTYVDAVVCDEWLYFSNFRKWMVEQDWQNADGTKKELDKDVLSPNKRGKLYSPDVCLFISKALNAFLTDNESCRGDLPIGVSWQTSSESYYAQVRNPFTEKYENLGRYATIGAAKAAYIKRKTELAVMYAEQQTDPRIAQALLSKDYSGDK